MELRQKARDRSALQPGSLAVKGKSTPVDATRAGDWQELFTQALRLMAALSSSIEQPHWTFGGGTVLMLRHNHRLSKDIDLFVPDPQYLGYLNPRLGGLAEVLVDEGLVDRYVEAAEYLKLLLKAGEIDVVVGPNLTDDAFEWVEIQGTAVKVESSAEILAKKMWHRGDRATARDLFDLGAIATLEPEAIITAKPFFTRHGPAFLSRLEQTAELSRRQFDEIDALDFSLGFDECLAIAKSVLGPVAKTKARRQRT